MTTTGIAFVDMGAEWNTVAALAIAIGKTLLVVLFFMHLRYSGRLVWVIAGAGVFWLILLIGGTLDDVITRPQSSPPAVAQPPAAPR
jgi:cytochrome c oxidase subunit 4